MHRTHADCSIDELESALAALAPPGLADGVPAPMGPIGPVGPTLPPDGTLVELLLGSDAAPVIDLEAQQAWAKQARGRSWWQAVPGDGPRRLLIGSGLPDAMEFARLFGPVPGNTETIAAARPAWPP